jgi:predicted AAA+ superfamily ATPase
MICANSPAQIISLHIMQGQLRYPGSLETIAHYLSLLKEAYLVAALETFTPRVLRKRAAPPKIVVLNNAFPSAVAMEGIPEPDNSPERFGSWVENACLAHALNSGQRVTYWREGPLEVDAVLDGSWGKWAVAFKTGTFEPSELRCLREFCRRYSRFRPIVLTGSRKGLDTAERAGVDAMSWKEFLLKGLRRKD